MFINSVSIIHNAMTLMDRGIERLNRDVTDVDGYVDMLKAEHMARAGVSAVRTEDDMYKTLLDVYA